MRSPGRALTRCDRGLQEGDTRRGERPLTLEPGEVGEEPGTGPAGAMGSLAQQPPSSRAPSVQNCEPERSCGVSHSVCGARYSSPSTPSWAMHPSPSRFRGLQEPGGERPRAAVLFPRVQLSPKSAGGKDGPA